MNTVRSVAAVCLGSLLALTGCGEEPEATAEEKALLSVKQYISTNLDELVAASTALQAAAPAPAEDGWNVTRDAAAVAAMKAEWKRARVAYEHVEGAIAVLFPELDVATDERYDGFLEMGPDENLFDAEGVTGVHAIERILWSDAIPDPVLEFERALPGYKAAAFPANRKEAEDFKTGLAARLVTDVTTMRDQFAPLALDPASAYRGVIGSLLEQLEKLQLAESGEEESRYAQFTLADMRANVAAGLVTFNFFRPWLLEKNGASVAEGIQAGFERLQAAYAALSGDALPPVPEAWSATPPEAALSTPFGKLHVALAFEADPDQAGSLVSLMNESARLMGIDQLEE